MTTSKTQTIADIARLAGVSKSTVSRALNDSPLIGVETKDRIRAIAAEHHFEMNEPARRLSRRQTNVVGLVMFDWGIAKRQDMFMLEVMGGISTGLHEEGYELLIVHPRFDETDWARRYLDTGQADGFILHAAQGTPQQIERLASERIPFVIWGPPSERNEYSSVGGDSLTGGLLATEHLLAIGRRCIGMIAGPPPVREVADRRAGYEAALTAAGIDVDTGLIVHIPWIDPEVGAAEAVERLLEHAPDLDAIFAHSDLFALNAIEALREHDKDIPGDVAVVGYDDIALAAYTNPPLTTIRQDGDLAGKLLARTLIQRLQTGAVTNVTIPAELVVRESA